MRIRNIIFTTLALVPIGLCVPACVSEKHEQTKLAAQAKVSCVDAEKIALTKTPNGTVKEGKLEREKGKLIWSFEIATPGTQDITEVGVDAVTGGIVSVEKETPEQQAKEKDEKK